MVCVCAGATLFELQKSYYDQLVTNYHPRFNNTQLFNQGVRPENVAKIAKGTSTNDKYPTSEKSLDILKIDVDSCDCHVLSQLMLDPFYKAKVTTKNQKEDDKRKNTHPPHTYTNFKQNQNQHFQNTYICVPLR